MALDKKWKYIKIQCLQPYSTDKPYGLRYIKLFQTNNDQLPTELEPHPSPLKVSPRLFNTPQHTKSLQSPVSTSSKRGPLSAPVGLPRTPKLPSLSSYRGDVTSSLSNTPKRPKREQDSADIKDSQEFEFAGLEKQSRLLKNTLKGNNEKLLNSNPILNRIAQEKKEKDKQEDENSGTGAGYVRRKLLHKDLESVSNKGIDFTSSYDDEKGASWERSKTARIYSAMKIGQLDNSCEMGEEEESSKWFGGRRRKRDKPSPVPTGKWVKRRGRLGTRKRENLPPTLLDVPLLMESNQTSLLDYYANYPSIEEKSPKEDSEDVICTRVNDTGTCSKASVDSRYEMCPICNELIPSYALELHANECAERTFDNSSTPGTSNTYGTSNTHMTSKVSHKKHSHGVVYLD